MRNTLDAVLALAAAPDGFTVTDLAEKVRALTGQTPAAYTGSSVPFKIMTLTRP